MSTPSSTVRTAVLVVAIVVSTVAAGFATPAGASLSVATAEDVVAGLNDVDQSVTISGQSPDNGGTDYYQVRVTDLTRTGAEITAVRFTNTGPDDDALADGWAPQYHPENGTITLAVTEDPADRDKKVDFDVVLGLDTTEAIAQDELRYEVTQYDTAGFDNQLSPQAAQFKLIGTNVLTATTSDESAGASPVYHNASLTLPTRERAITYIAINTSGANYGDVTREDIAIRRNGGPDLVTDEEPAVGTNGSSLLVPLDAATNFYDGDDVSIVIGNARNPANTSHLTVSFRTAPDEPVFATSDEIEVTVECAEETSVSTSESGTGNSMTAGAVGAALGAGAIALWQRRTG